MPKVLVLGDVRGNMEEAMKRVTTVNSKNGPFDACFCVGEFYFSNEVDEEQAAQPNFVEQNPLAPYIKGQAECPLPLYFLCGKAWGPQLDQTSEAQEVAKNIHFLGSHGITEIAGLRVAFLSGHYPLHATGSLQNMQANALTKQHSPEKPVDILLTAQWSKDVCTLLQGGAAPDVGKDLKTLGSSAVTLVAKSLAPRYHFAGSEGIFFERAPYINPPANDNPGSVQHVTRFISMASVGNSDKKNRWIYAASVNPVAQMDMETLKTIPAGATRSPFLAPTFQAGSSLSTVGGDKSAGLSETICHVANLPYGKITEDAITFAFAPCGDVARVHIAKDRDTGKPRGFAFVEFATKEGAKKAVEMSGFDFQGRSIRVSYAPEQSGHKRGADDSGEGGGKKQKREIHPLMLRSADCWFCLSSPKVEKHLVVSIGDEAYVALAKGQLVPEHVLILPITHYPSASQVPDSVWGEVEKYKKSLAKCFKEELNMGMVLYERATNVKSGQSHCHIQAVPVPLPLESKIRDHVISCGRGQNIGFDPKPRWRDEELDQYVLYEVPGQQQVLLHQVPQGARHPLNFAREVVATLLGMPQRADWKNCALPEREEEAVAEKFKKMFAKYDWSLEDDE